MAGDAPRERLPSTEGLLTADTQFRRVPLSAGDRPILPSPPCPSYGLAPPRTLADAIGQGEQIGERECRRLGLREQPIGDVAALVATRGVQVSPVPQH